ncbi:MAG: nucleotidyltransferase family protein [Cytophagales bacterium]
MDFDELKDIVIPVLKKHKVTKAGVFGSFAKKRATEKSDVDILVELTDPVSLFDFIGIKQELEEVLKKPVDLVEYRAIKPIIRASILNSELRIYG